MNFILLIVWILFGCLTAYLAKNRGRDVYAWFFAGFFLGIFGLILLFILPKKTATPTSEPNQESTTIDIMPEVLPEHKELFWYYLDSQNQQKGPMSFNALVSEWKEKKITEKTYVWNESLETWKPLSEFLKK